MIGRPTIRRGEDGAVAVEFAVILTVLLFMILGIVQFGLVFWNWNTMLLAVEEAGRYAMLYNSTNPSGSPPPAACSFTPPVTTLNLPNCAVAWGNQNGGSNFDPPGVTCTNPDGTACTTASTTMVFTVSYTFNFITSFTLTRAIQVPVI